MVAVAVTTETQVAPERTDDGWPRGITVALGAAGAIGMVLITVSGVATGPTGPTGSSLERWIVSLTPKGTAGNVLGIVTLVLGLVLVLSAWLLLGLLLRRGASLRPLFKIAGVWSLPLFIGPPIFSRDLYSYAADGAMVASRISPYSHGPAALGVTASNFLAPVSSAWLGTPSPYGPLFLRIAWVAVRLSGGSVVMSIMLLRLFEVGGIVLIAVSLPRLAQAAGKDPARAVWLGVCNPLVLFHFIAGGHNDALMIGLIVAGLTVATTANRPLLGIVLCMLAATIKAPAIIPAAFIVLDAVRKAPAEERVKEFARLSALGSLAFVGISWLCGLGWGWVGALGIPGTNRILLTPTTFLAHMIAMGVGHEMLVLKVVRAAAALATAAGIAYLLWRAPRIGTVRAAGFALALLVALGPIVLPWYALWGLIVIAAVGRRIERGYAILASVVLAIVVEASGSSMPDVVLMGAVVLLTGVGIAIAWHPVRHWIRHDLVVAIEEYRRRGRIAQSPEVLWLAVPSNWTDRPRESDPVA
jgi:alpha-1,6-mannosyltransferase